MESKKGPRDAKELGIETDVTADPAQLELVRRQLGHLQQAVASRIVELHSPPLLHLMLEGREDYTIALDPAQIESIQDVTFHESYGRGGRAIIRMKSGAEYTVRETRVQIESQMEARAKLGMDGS